jgi:uncharacterized protein (TIGR01244 family)
MSQRIRITKDITIGPQPSKDALGALPGQGFRAVCNLRVSGEENQRLLPEDEGVEVRRLGLTYAHVPVPVPALRLEGLDRFREELARLPRPLYVHCSTGKRAGTLVVIDVGLREGWTGEETLRRAQQLGIDLRDPDLREFIVRSVEARRAPREVVPSPT